MYIDRIVHIAYKDTKYLRIKNYELRIFTKLYQQHPCITTDSRDCPKGSIFLALKGESFDGNKFAASALEKGCAYAIIDDQSVMPANDDRFILVDDCLQTFKDLAREHRRQFDIPVIGITGTNGKTTTKELNFNNDVGVPKTLFRLTKDHEIAVIEMGASHPGDIKTLAETAEPTCGLITNVGKAHLQGFGSFEGVIKTKCELYDFLRTRENGLIFINADNDHLVDQIGDEEDIWLSPYSTDPENQYTCISGEIIACDPFLKFRWREPLMTLEEEGRSTKWHKVQNFGVDRKKICAALEAYTPSNNRSQMTVTEKNHLVVDAYNANPTSMQAALDNFRRMEVPHKMAILGQMGELGTESDAEHRQLVADLEASGFEEVWLVGDNFADIPCAFRKFHDVEEVKAAIREQQPEGRYILIKGSNSNKLFQLPELL